MRVLVMCDKGGEIQAVAVLNRPVADGFRVELEGGGTTHELDVDPAVMAPDDLLGKRGAERHRQAHDTLREMIRGRR